MLSIAPQRSPNRCVVCDTPGDFPYDARFDGAACDACHAMLTIRDDVFRRLHPEHAEAIQANWRDLKDPARARDVGRRYVEMGYFEEPWDAAEAGQTGPDDRLLRVLKELYEVEDEGGEEDGEE